MHGGVHSERRLHRKVESVLRQKVRAHAILLDVLSSLLCNVR